jgi:hypothetical protein
MTLSVLESENLLSEISVVDVPLRKTIKRRIGEAAPKALLAIGVTLTVIWSATLVLLVVLMV